MNLTAKAKRPPLSKDKAKLLQSQKEKEAPMTGLRALIHKAITGAVHQVLQGVEDSKHNVGRSLAMAYIWDEAEKVAKGMSADAWKRIGQMADLDEEREPGTYELIDSPSFAVTLEVTQPVKRFNEEAMVKALATSKWKIPMAEAKGLVVLGKPPGKSSRKFNVIERK